MQNRKNTVWGGGLFENFEKFPQLGDSDWETNSPATVVPGMLKRQAGKRSNEGNSIDVLRIYVAWDRDYCLRLIFSMPNPLYSPVDMDFWFFRLALVSNLHEFVWTVE